VFIRRGFDVPVGYGMVYMDETEETALVANDPGARCLTDDFFTVTFLYMKVKLCGKRNLQSTI
jgi:hypothetical protein